MMITVLTPTFNRGRLQSLWDSLQKQTVKDFEWLVVDDGSTDGTKDLITQLQEKVIFQYGISIRVMVENTLL